MLRGGRPVKVVAMGYTFLKSINRKGPLILEGKGKTSTVGEGREIDCSHRKGGGILKQEHFDVDILKA